MAITRTRPAPAETAATAAPASAADVAVLARVVARLAVAVSNGPSPASFRAIATRELRIATDAEADVIERLYGG